MLNSAKRQSYLAGWFAGSKSRDYARLNVTCCVLSSHRRFSGIELEGVAIRDYGSLERLISDGTLAMGFAGEDRETVKHQFRVISEGGFSAAYLDDYLGRDSKYFKSFLAFMNPISDPMKFETLTIAWEAFVYNIELGDWLAHMASIDCRRLPDV